MGPRGEVAPTLSPVPWQLLSQFRVFWEALSKCLSFQTMACCSGLGGRCFRYVTLRAAISAGVGKEWVRADLSAHQHSECDFPTLSPR